MTSIQNIAYFLKRLRDKTTCRFLIKGFQNRIEHEDAVVRDVDLNIQGDTNTIFLSPGARLVGVKIIIKGSGNRVFLGKDCAFKQGGLIWCDGNNNSLSIGDETTIEEASLVLSGGETRLCIGANGMIAYGVEIRTGDGHALLDSSTLSRINSPKDVTIGDHVWVAANATILKGVTIQNDSVIAAGAMVTNSFEAGVVIAGNPARVVRHNVTWDRR